MQDTAPKKIIASRVTRSVVSILVVLIVSGLTFYLLNQFAPRTSPVVDPKLTPASIIEQYSAKSIQTKLYVAGGDPLLGSPIVTKPQNLNYSIATNAKISESFKRTDAQVKTNDTVTIDQSAAFLEGLGLRKSSSESNGNKTVTLFKDNSNTCQLATTGAVGDVAASFGLGCVATNDIDKVAEKTKALIAQYDEAAALSTFTAATLLTITSSDQKFTMLYLRGQDAQASISTLLFLTKDAAQTYLGMRTSPTISNPATTNSPKLIQSLKNAQYAKSLTGIIEKY